MSPAEFCDFISPYDRALLVLKVLHGPHAAQYLIMMLCPSCIAHTLIATSHRKRYNQLEDSECEIYFVESLSIVGSVDDKLGRYTYTPPLSDRLTAVPSDDLQDVDVTHTQPKESTSHFRDPVEFFIRFELHQYCAICLENVLPTVRLGKQCNTYVMLSNEVSEGDVHPPNTAELRPTETAKRANPSFNTHPSYDTPQQHTGGGDDCGGMLRGEEAPPNTSDEWRMKLEGTLYKLLGCNALGATTNALCGHSFHSNCLRAWPDVSCPVCRYQQYPSDQVGCDICGRGRAIRMCMVCGFIGCHFHFDDDDDNAAEEEQAEGNDVIQDDVLLSHSLQHFLDTNHTFSLEMDTRRVWDYTRRGYVHRLIQNRLDGKMVEVESPQSENGDEIQEDTSSRRVTADDVSSYEKRKERYMEQFNLVLAQQLDSQRDYYEEEVERLAAMYEGPTKECMSILVEERERAAALEKIVNEMSDSINMSFKELQNLHAEQQELELEKGRLEHMRETIALQHQHIRQQRVEELEGQQNAFSEKMAKAIDLQQRIHEMKLHLSLRERFVSNTQTRESSIFIGEQERPTRRRRRHYLSRR